ncbi:hypothetical protein [Peribacillus sp. SCS-155]|uniref:hypothetical protein n=1 Tax=Peribacillus sedimenti TaxID=3115297 RepID=UPI00390625DE
MVILIIFAAAIILFSVFYTLSVGRKQRAVQGEYDSPINESVRRHPYLLNPIFLAISLFVVLAFVLIFYWSLVYI